MICLASWECCLCLEHKGRTNEHRGNTSSPFACYFSVHVIWMHIGFGEVNFIELKQTSVLQILCSDAN
jgi:hypothetical protein